VTAVGSAVVLIAGIVIALGLVWRYHQAIVDRLPGIVAPDSAGSARARALRVRDARGGHRRPTGTILREHRTRGDGSVATVRRRRAVAVWLALSGRRAHGSVCRAWDPVPPYVLLFVIPLANLAGAAPLPGGLGGIEAAFVTLLVPTTGIQASVITAAVPHLPRCDLLDADPDRRPGRVGVRRPGGAVTPIGGRSIGQ